MSKNHTSLEAHLKSIGLLACEEELKDAMDHHRERAGRWAECVPSTRSMRLMERDGMTMTTEQVVEMVNQLGEWLAWRVDTNDLPMLSSFDAHFQQKVDGQSSKSTEVTESKPSDDSLAMETFLHGGSFILAEMLLDQLAPLSIFWKVTKEAFHLHLVQHLEIFLRFGSRPPMPRMMAGKASVQGEILPEGKVMVSSKASGCSPEIQVMEICKALCFRWASPCYAKIPPAQLDIMDEIYFFVHAPVLVRKDWQSLLALLSYGVPLSSNSITDEQNFLLAFGEKPCHDEISIQRYISNANRLFVDQKQLITDPNKLREHLQHLIQVST